MLVAAEPGLADGLLLLSYPLHPPQRPSELRVGHFGDLQKPGMFVHGTQDIFGSIAEMTEALTLVKARTRLLPVSGAGHELITKRSENQVSELVVQAFRSFISEDID
ncbi:hypothetical protein ACPOL_4079 [Acidisarcina polymorpha]|uniref:KANL3/Tex30 alpha/beta hydrolase-like domain-containing protein n=2 Tax=Acidisarcina polymorpha TaxID=2211140 RepID=A0A2Z5G4B2_9BACT|nr:hypothetical protein ACPOL_4079 [Acidisarcina polymorpha]